MRLIPDDSGKIIFRRQDLKGREFLLSAQNVVVERGTVLSFGNVKIQTIEHLMAVLYAFGVDSLIIELNGGEIPIMDGSALPFSKELLKAGFQDLNLEKKTKKIVESFVVRDKESHISAHPEQGLRLSYKIEYKHPAIGTQALSFTLNEESFLKEIAPARTFGFLEEISSLRSRGLAMGGSLENAVVLDQKGIINGPLRFQDEFVRHKILDLIGDLSLYGYPLEGSFFAFKAGHALHLKAVRFLVENDNFVEDAGIHS